jgi:hypothetical protein
MSQNKHSLGKKTSMGGKIFLSKKGLKLDSWMSRKSVGVIQLLAEIILIHQQNKLIKG